MLVQNRQANSNLLARLSVRDHSCVMLYGGMRCTQVADFGLARVLKDKGHIKTQTFGTVTHMPPELLAKGKTPHSHTHPSESHIIHTHTHTERVHASKQSYLSNTEP